MSRAELAGLAGVFLGGATPWLEAIIVIPAGIVGGLNPLATVTAGVTGNLATVAVAAWFGERIRAWWRSRRHAASGADGSSDGHDRAATEPKRAARVERVVKRWGLPALAVLGPIGLGTQLSAVVAVGLGIKARTAFIWVGWGTVAWSVVAGVAAVTGLSVMGVGS